MKPEIRGISFYIPLYLVLFCSGSAPVLADSLYLEANAGPVGCGPTTLVYGAGNIICASNAIRGESVIATAQGDLSKGVFGTVVYIDSNFGGGSADSANLEAIYNFAIPNVQYGTAVFYLATGGLSTVELAPTNIGYAQTEFGYSLTESVTINGVPAPEGFVFLPNGGSTITVSAPIVNGNTQLWFSEQSSVAAVCPRTDCWSESNFLDPTSITSASAYDSNGNLVPDSTFVSQSGFNPNAGGIAITPEPASYLLFSTGVLGLFLFSTRIRQRSPWDSL